jgi:hypothetical protein
VIRFIPYAQERNEGFGDVNAIMTKVQYTSPKTTFKSHLVGYFDLPDTKNFVNNMDSFYSDKCRYSVPIFAKGFDAHLLYVHKFNVGETMATRILFSINPI